MLEVFDGKKNPYFLRFALMEIRARALWTTEGGKNFPPFLIFEVLCSCEGSSSRQKTKTAILLIFFPIRLSNFQRV